MDGDRHADSCGAMVEKAMMIDVSVITVTHESEEFIADQILSVATSAIHTTYEQIIVDNASCDGTAKLIREGYAQYTRLIENRKNEGFAAANDLAVKQAQGRYLLFLNPDMRMELGSLDKIVAWMNERPEVGIAGCKLLDREGEANEELHPRRFPPFLCNLAYFFTVKRSSFAKRLFHYFGFDTEKEQEVDSVRGAFMLVRREVVEKLGRAFDSRYFLLIEDLDFCREVKDLGYKVVYTPVITCTDWFHRSFLYHSRFWKHWQLSKSIWLYTVKWHPWHEVVLLSLAFPFGLVLRLLRPCK